MKIFKFRLFLVVSIIMIFSTVIAVRLGYLFIIQKKFFKDQGDARAVRTVTTPAYRGLIFDRNGEPLAVSTEVKTIWVNPSLIMDESSKNNTEQELSFNYTELNKLLGLKPGYVENKIIENKSKEFIYIKRHVPPDIANKAIELDLPGVFEKKEFKRFYPNGEVTAHVTGFTSIDEIGQEGLEYALDKELLGKPGKKQVLRDRLGRVIKTIRQESVAKAGENVTLSIDLRLQYLTYRALKEAIIKHDALAGTAIIVNAKTGEILALANQPSYNPNDRSNIDHNEMRNRAITDLFEPGSLIKPLSMASILSNSHLKSTANVNTNPGVMQIGKHKVRDIRNYGEISVNDVIKKSSNVGISKLTLQYDSGEFVRLLHDVGFERNTLRNFPGEAEGWVNEVQYGEDFKLATLSFGYGLTTTPLQLLQAYSIFANQGRFIPVTLLKKGESDNDNNLFDEHYIVEPRIADQVLAMLNSVMQVDGTGRLARLKNYETAGKTGTTRRVTKDGYDENSHNAMFIGMAPYPNPRFAMIVVIIDPKKNGYYGGMVAGPVFKQVMPKALQLYGVSPS